MRIRFPFAISFVLLLFASSSIGLLPHSSLPSTPERIQPYIPSQSDKALHFLCFFALTLTFYFTLDTTRRRILHFTLFICTLLLGVGSEVVQGLLPNGRDWDPWDVLANVLGSLLAVGIAGWFHRRSAERRRLAKYSALATGEDDLELGEASSSPPLTDGLGEQESGVVHDGSAVRSETQNTPIVLGQKKTVEEEVDNWDENVEDEDTWSEDGDETRTNETKVTPATSSRGSEEAGESGRGFGIKKVAVE